MSPNNFYSLAEEYERSLKIRNLAESTIKEERRRLEKFFEYLSARNIIHIDRITKDVIKDYQIEIYQCLNHKGRPNGIASQNKMLTGVKLFFRFLKDNDHIISDPARGIPYAKEPKRLPRSILSRSEAKKIMNIPDTKSVIGYRDRTILEVLYSTGIRKSELINLTLSDVDYKEGFLRVNNGKGRKDRVVPLGKIACRYLENYIQSVRPALIKAPYNNHLFLSIRGNKLSKDVVRMFIKKYAQKAKIKLRIYAWISLL